MFNQLMVSEDGVHGGAEESSHFDPQAQDRAHWERCQTFETSKSLIQGPTSLLILHKQFHQLETKSSGMCVYGGHPPSNNHSPFGEP